MLFQIHINLYFNPDSLPVSTFDNLTWPPPPLLPFSPLAAPANTLISIHIQLMKATLLEESSLYFIFSPGSLCYSDVYRRESGRCHTLPFFLTFFYHFTFPGFPFILINKILSSFGFIYYIWHRFPWGWNALTFYFIFLCFFLCYCHIGGLTTICKSLFFICYLLVILKHFCSKHWQPPQSDKQFDKIKIWRRKLNGINKER